MNQENKDSLNLKFKTLMKVIMDKVVTIFSIGSTEPGLSKHIWLRYLNGRKQIGIRNGNSFEFATNYAVLPNDDTIITISNENYGDGSTNTPIKTIRMSTATVTEGVNTVSAHINTEDLLLNSTFKYLDASCSYFKNKVSGDVFPISGMSSKGLQEISLTTSGIKFIFEVGSAPTDFEFVGYVKLT